MKAILSNCIIIFIAYIVGALPTGAWLCRYYKSLDITAYGSGNSGATNVGRALGRSAFCVVLLVDSLKAFGYLHYLGYWSIADHTRYVAAATLLLGNGYSIFLQGRGGKGIATSIGIACTLFSPSLLISLLLCWFFTLYLCSTVGVASAATCAVLPFFGWYSCDGNWHLLALMLFMSLWGLYRHTENIKTYPKQTRKFQ